MSSQREKSILKTVFISLVIDLLGFTVILPLFPSLLEHYDTHDQTAVYRFMKSTVQNFRSMIGVPETENIDSVLFGGMIGSLFSLLQFLNSPVFGALSDVHGRKIMIVTSLIGSSLSCLLWAVSDNFATFLFARTVAGLSEANVSISTAIIADLDDKKSRTQGMAVIGIAFSIGFICGPMIGAYFTHVFSGHKFFVGPAIFGFVITVIDVVYVSVCLPETLPESKRASSVSGSIKDFRHLLNPVSLFKFSSVKSLSESKSVNSVRKLGFIYFSYLFLFSGLEFTLSFVAYKRFNFTRMDLGKMFAVLGCTMALVQGGYIRRKMVGNEKKLAIKGLLLLIPGFVIIGLANQVYLFHAGLFLFSFAAASVVPCLTSMVSNFGTESEKGKLMGIFRSLGALARATGPIFMSSLYWIHGATFTYLLGAFLLLVPLMKLKGLKVENFASDKKE